MVMGRITQVESIGGEGPEAGDVALGAAVEIGGEGMETKKEWKYDVLQSKRRKR